MHEASQPKTQFWWNGELWHWTRMTYGYVNASAMFQTVMDTELAAADLLDNATCYIDDVCVHSASFEEHVVHVTKFLDMLRRSGLKAHLHKCAFGCPSVEFLGHQVGANGVAPEQAKVAVILEMGEPESASDLRSQLGLIHYYRDFIPNAAGHLDILRPLLKKDYRWTSNSWTAERKNALDKVKRMVAPSTGGAIRAALR